MSVELAQFHQVVSRKSVSLQEGSGILPGCDSYYDGIRGCRFARFAQPPANFWQPSGLWINAGRVPGTRARRQCMSASSIEAAHK